MSASSNRILRSRSRRTSSIDSPNAINEVIDKKHLSYIESTKGQFRIKSSDKIANEKRKIKKKLRTTQEFLHVSSMLMTPDVVKSIKKKTKKKARKNNHLPKIDLLNASSDSSHIKEDNCCKESNCFLSNSAEEVEELFPNIGNLNVRADLKHKMTKTSEPKTHTNLGKFVRSRPSNNLSIVKKTFECSIINSNTTLSGKNKPVYLHKHTDEKQQFNSLNGTNMNGSEFDVRGNSSEEVGCKNSNVETTESSDSEIEFTYQKPVRNNSNRNISDFDNMAELNSNWNDIKMKFPNVSCKNIELRNRDEHKMKNKSLSHLGNVDMTNLNNNARDDIPMKYPKESSPVKIKHSKSAETLDITRNIPELIVVDKLIDNSQNKQLSSKIMTRSASLRSSGNDHTIEYDGIEMKKVISIPEKMHYADSKSLNTPIKPNSMNVSVDVKNEITHSNSSCKNWNNMALMENSLELGKYDLVNHGAYDVGIMNNCSTYQSPRGSTRKLECSENVAQNKSYIETKLRKKNIDFSSVNKDISNMSSNSSLGKKSPSEICSLTLRLSFTETCPMFKLDSGRDVQPKNDLQEPLVKSEQNLNVQDEIANLNSTFEIKKEDISADLTSFSLKEAEQKTPILSKHSTRFKRRDTYELEESVNDISLLQSESKRISHNILSSIVSNPKSIKNMNRRTYELDESVTDISILKSASNLPNELNSAQETQLNRNSENETKSFGRVTKRRKYIQFNDLITNISSKKENMKIENVSIPWATDDISFNNRKSLKLSDKKVNFKGDTHSITVQHDEFNSPPSGTSTPKPIGSSKGFNLLKTVLIRDSKNVSSVKSSTNVNKSLTKSSRVKMPNFARIHQKAFDKMEGINQLTERKAERAKQLLSGQKPTNSSKFKNKSPYIERNVCKPKRHLPFENMDVQKTIKTGPSVAGFNYSHQSPPKSAKSTKDKDNRSHIPLITKKLYLPNSPSVHKKTPSKSPNQRCLNRFGFKMNFSNIDKDEQIKAVANKRKLPKNDLDGKRYEIKGVRSNRRFELLMKMRKNVN